MKGNFAQGMDKSNKFIKEIGQWLKDCLCHHKLRMLLGLVFLAAELYLFLGTGVMGEEYISFHTGEGSWEVAASEEAPGFCQEFIPQHRELRAISFLMYKEHLEKQDGAVSVIIADEANEIVFDKKITVSEAKNGKFTDVEVGLEVSPRKKYYLTVLCEPSSDGEYPALGVCSLDYELPESGKLVQQDEVQGAQLVSRFYYDGVVPAGKMRNVLIICVVTALGVMFGLPDNKRLRMVTACILLIVGPYVLGSRLELLTYKEVYYSPIAMRWNLGLMYGLEILILLCTHSPRITIAVTNIILTIIYSANYFMVAYRGTPLRVNDLSAIGTAAQVVGDYKFVPNDHLAFAWGLLAVLVVFGVQTGVGRKCKKQDGTDQSAKSAKSDFLVKKALSYVVTIAIAVVVGVFGAYQLIHTDFLYRVGFVDDEYKGFDYDVIYYANGYLVGTCLDLKNMNVKPVEGYSVESVEEILTVFSAFSGEAEEELPHVILVMNESFSDLRVLGELGLNQENMAFFNSLEENTVRGYVNASVVGGGTANSEFEVLTGCNMAFFPPNYYPYEQAVKRPLNSMVSQMKKYGYTTYAMHPEPGNNWSRDIVYKYYGFDEMFFEEDFAGAEEIHSGVSDAATYEKIIELYENRKEGEKVFIFDVTMQNHGGYAKEEGPDEVVASAVNEHQVDEFLSLVKISDEAFADLVRYFESQDEKVVVCMFGDHQPWVSNLIVGEDSELPLEQLQKKYKTPFVIWANYDIEEAKGLDISMNYLGGLLQRTVGLPLSPYLCYQEKLREEYPIITLNCYADKEGNFYNWGSEGNEFPEYRMLQYNYLFDDIVEWGY